MFGWFPDRNPFRWKKSRPRLSHITRTRRWTPSEPVSDETEQHGENGFEAFVSAVESVKLRSEAQNLIAQAPHYIVHGVIHSVSRTLLGAGPYRNGHTAHCEGEGGVMFRVMLKPRETPPAAGGFYHASVALHDWDVALKQMVCLEV